MGKQFSWIELTNPPVKKELKKSSSKRTPKQIKECLQLDQLFWMQNTKKKLPQSLEKLDKTWYCQVIKNAKYSRIGDSFIDPVQNIKCVKIERPHFNETKPTLVVKKPPVKHEYVIKKPKSESQSYCYDTNQASPSTSMDGHSSTGSSEGVSLLSASEIVRQAQRFLPKLEISPSCFSNPIAMFQSPKETIDVLNYDFSFTSPLIKS